jgi:hypothetical protein
MLVVIALFARNGIMGLAEFGVRWLRRPRPMP